MRNIWSEGKCFLKKNISNMKRFDPRWWHGHRIDPLRCQGRWSTCFVVPQSEYWPTWSCHSSQGSLHNLLLVTLHFLWLWIEAHTNFIEAGADIILTNSYKTNVPLLMEVLGSSEEDAIEAVKTTLRNAVTAVAGRQVIVAGCIGPVECVTSYIQGKYLSWPKF